MSGQIESLNKLNFENKGSQYCDLQYFGLQYFGAMSASIAHEIKNVLAITNENAGLLEDLSLISIKNGQPLETERVARLSKKVMEQIKRADNIVKKMSEFAHSVDEPVKAVSLSEVVELTLELGRRTASTQNITLAPVRCDSTISVQTNPFMFMNLLWLVIKSAFKRVNSEKNIQIEVAKEDKQAKIIIINLIDYNIISCQKNIGTRDIEQEKELIHLADWLNVKVDMNKADKIIITVSSLTK